MAELSEFYDSPGMPSTYAQHPKVRMKISYSMWCQRLHWVAALNGCH